MKEIEKMFIPQLEAAPIEDFTEEELERVIKRIEHLEFTIKMADVLTGEDYKALDKLSYIKNRTRNLLGKEVK